MRTYNKGKLSIARILQWADAHYRRTGCWPSVHSGRIPEAPGENWTKVNSALEHGFRGMRGGDSLSRLLKRRRGSCASERIPNLTIKQILAWADDHRRRTGRWPKVKSGAILAAPANNWQSVDNALRLGLRGQRPGSSLAKLLDRRRHVRNRKDAPRLSAPLILRWADGHHRRTREWPTLKSGPVLDAPGETWSGVGAALYVGTRGLPGGTTLATFLSDHRGVRNRKAPPPLTPAMILRWADAHIRRTGRRPTVPSGPIPERPGETWCSVSKALERGRRGFRGGSSLARFLDQHNRYNPRPPRRHRRRRLRK
ncbi:MAG: hypothetical protein C4547_05185 [Phycisphaerales bacterium]|nr:MAG: hypothetical protein C4547_05185 [Phycisphaerales bacterium]